METTYEKGQEAQSVLNVSELGKKESKFTAIEVNKSVDEINKLYHDFQESAKKTLSKYNGQIGLSWHISKEGSELGENASFDKVSPTVEVDVEAIDDRSELFRLRKLVKPC